MGNGTYGTLGDYNSAWKSIGSIPFIHLRGRSMWTVVSGCPKLPKLRANKIGAFLASASPTVTQSGQMTAASWSYSGRSKHNLLYKFSVMGYDFGLR
eukprot:4046659-Karenia_brevis.AAC.1